MVNLSPKDIIDALSSPPSTPATAIIEQLDETPPHALFQDFNELVESNLASSYICALLNGSTASTNHAATRREFCFIYAIKALKGGLLSTSERRQLLSRLHTNLSLLPAASHLRIADSITSPFSPSSTPESIAGHTAALEILPALLSSSIDSKQHAVLELVQQQWSQQAIVVISHSLTEIAPASELLATQAYDKITSYLVYPPTGFSAVLEDIPQLIYHLTLLTNKYTSLMRKCLDRVVILLDAMAEAPHDRHVSAIIATILHHMSLLIVKDQNMSQAILAMTKAFSPSPASLSLLLLTSRSPRMESKIFSLATDRIEYVYACEKSKNHSVWIQQHIWESACRTTPFIIHNAFLRLMHSPLLTEDVSPPLLQLGLILLSKIPKSAAVPSLYASAPTLHLLGSAPINTSESLGSWIIGELYFVCEAARSTIMKELISRLQVTGHCASPSSTDTCIISVLHRIAALHPDLPLEFPALISELHPTIARDIIQLLADAATIQPGIADRVILALRKGSFSRDLPCQAATLSALIAVLQLQLSASSSPPLTSYLSQTSQVETVDSFGIAFDEIIALCKRFLHSQFSVRYIVYRGFCELSQEKAFRRIALRVLMQHSSVYVRDTIAVEKIVSTNGAILESIGDLSMSLLFIARKGISRDAEESLSQGSSLSICNECNETCNFLWRLVGAVMATPCPAVIASLATYSQCLAFSDMYRSCMILVMLLPDSRSLEQRYRYLEQLIEMKNTADGAIAIYRSQQLSTQKKRKREEAKKDDEAAVMVTQELFTEHSMGISMTSGSGRHDTTLPTLQRGTFKHRPLNCIALVELEGIIQLLLALNLMEGEYAEQQHETQEEEDALDLSTSVRVTEIHEYTLSTCLELLEQFVSYAISLKATAQQCCNVQRLRNEEMQIPRDIVASADTLLRVTSQLFGVLLRDFIRTRSSLAEHGGSDETLVLCGRCMLGCLYIVCLICEIGSERTDTTIALSRLMQEGFRTARVGGDQIHSIVISDIDGAHQILELLTRHFVKLYSSMMTSEKGAANIVVSMISVFLQHLRGQYKKLVVEQIFKHKEKLADTSSAVCQHILECTCETCDTPADGFSVLGQVGELIEHTGKNSSTVCTALLSTIDKILSEFDMLYAVSNQASSVLQPDTLSMMCLTLRKTMTVGVVLLQYLDKSVVVKIVTLWVRLTKLHVKLIKSSITYTTKTSPAPALLPMFCDLCSVVANVISPQLQEYLAHNLATKTKSGKRDAKDARLGKIIPELIYQLEQVDSFIIKLTSSLKDRDKHIAGKWIKRIAARDFKVKVQHQAAGGTE